MRMIIKKLKRKLILVLSFMIVLSGNCNRGQESLSEIPSQKPPPQTETTSVSEPPETAPPYTGQPIVFIKKDNAVLYSKPSESSSVRVRLNRDALLVLIDKGEQFLKVHAPITGDVGYVKAIDVTDSMRTSAQSQARCKESSNNIRVKMMKEFGQFPSIEALERYYFYPFISSDDMLKMISIYKGNIGNYHFAGQSALWELKPDSLPRSIIKKLRSDSLAVSAFAAGSSVVLLAGEPFLYNHEEYDEEGVIKKPLDKAVRIIKSRLFEESLRLIRRTRETGTGPIVVTHGPPHSECHQCEILVSLFGVGKFIHTYEKRVPVKLLLKKGLAEGYITRVDHSTFEVSSCYMDGGKGLFFIQTSLPEGEKIYGILLGLGDNMSPVLTLTKNGDWTADLNSDGINDLKCLFIKEAGGYDELLSAYYFVNNNGKWVLTDKRSEPECS